MFLEKCAEGKKIAFSMNDPLVVHHYDADGLSSAAIVIGSFLKENRKVRRLCIKKLDDQAIETIKKEKEIIFVDLGGGNTRVNELGDILIIDHHQTEGIQKFQINPLLFGIDGGRELSSSGTAYCIFRNFPDLGITGAIGDMQHPLIGMNRYVLEEGVSKGEIRVDYDLRFYGRYSRNLKNYLIYSDDPYIEGLSFREERVENLLNELDIDKERKYADLNDDEKKRLVSSIAVISKSKNLFGESYVFPKREMNETYEANEFSTLLNACGRHNNPEIGIKVALGDMSVYKDANELLNYHRKMIRSGIEFANANIQDFGTFLFIDGRGKIDESIIGIVCGMSNRTKPVIGISLSDNSIKISGRGKNINMGELMKGCNKIGGIGGGHKVAAGASIPQDRLNDFLLFANEYIKNNSIN